MSEVSAPKTGGTGKVRRIRSSVRLDMTPMVDLAFLLLTFFILTSVLIKPFSIILTMPEKRGDDETRPIPKDRLMTIILGEKDVVYWYMGTDDPQLNASDFSANGIRKVILHQKASINKLHIFIKPSQKSRYKNMVDILDEMIITKTENYSLVKITGADDQLMTAYHMARALR